MVENGFEPEFPSAVQQQLAQHDAVGAWLDGKAAPLEKVAASAELQAQLRLEDEAADALRTERYRHGALNIETTELRPIVLGEQVVVHLRNGAAY